MDRLPYCWIQSDNFSRELSFVILQVFALGSLQANCYLVGCPEHRVAAVIDPGGDPDPVIRAAKKQELSIETIINTHGHLDHVAGNQALREATAAKLCIGRQDGPMLSDDNLNLSTLVGMRLAPQTPDVLWDDQTVVTVGTLEFTVLHTPGHTPGGICLYGHEVVFTGDTLFAGSIGRTDLPRGDYEQLITSIKEKLLPLPSDTRVYPGHGPSSTMAMEKQGNPFLQ